MTGGTTSRGFTIIEVILFLAITGLMLAGVFAGISGSVNRQRYQDASTSLMDFFQGQYNLVDNVHSNRSDTVSCGTGGVNLGSPQPRGTSDCSIIGRYVTTSDGKVLVSRPVYAAADVTSLSEIDDNLTNLNLSLAPDTLNDDDEQYTVAWSSYVYTDGNDSNRDFTMLLVRLPSSGLTRTYFTSSANATIANTIADTSTDSLAVCVATDGLVNHPPTGAKILRLAPNNNGVQPILASEDLC